MTCQAFKSFNQRIWIHETVVPSKDATTCWHEAWRVTESLDAVRIFGRLDSVICVDCQSFDEVLGLTSRSRLLLQVQESPLGFHSLGVFESKVKTH